jgi:hypothetical protein
MSRRLSLSNGKSFVHEQPLADLDFEILGAGKRDFGMGGSLASEQWETLKNQ